MEASPPRGVFTAQDILRPEILLFIAAIFVLISGIGSRLITTIIIALMMMGAAAISLGLIASPLLEKAFPTFSVSTVCGVILFFFSIENIARGEKDWSLWVLLIGSLITLFAAFIAFYGRKPGFRRRAG